MYQRPSMGAAVMRWSPKSLQKGTSTRSSFGMAATILFSQLFEQTDTRGQSEPVPEQLRLSRRDHQIARHDWAGATTVQHEQRPTGLWEELFAGGGLFGTGRFEDSEKTAEWTNSPASRCAHTQHRERADPSS